MNDALPQGWITEKLGDLGETKNGLNFGKECQYKGEIKLINVKDCIRKRKDY